MDLPTIDFGNFACVKTRGCGSPHPRINGHVLSVTLYLY